jgi:hypothetical protein
MAVKYNTSEVQQMEKLLKVKLDYCNSLSFPDLISYKKFLRVFMRMAVESHQGKKI